MVTVNGIPAGTSVNNETKFTVKETIGILRLCIRLIFPENKQNITSVSGTCTTVEDTASKIFNILYKVLYSCCTFAVAGVDYVAVREGFVASPSDPMFYKNITILPNPLNSQNRRFFLHILGDCGIDIWIEICILDDKGSVFI